MSGTIVRCPSCKRVNKLDARYCIDCGSILRPIYCSSCGTANPEGLEQCLECGKTLPTLMGIRWGPIVTVLKPTSAMTNEEIGELGGEPEGTADESLYGNLMSRHDQKTKR
jgi:RNA polymerase subunit RPABC4/transcription elongation factor Spt4